MPDISKLEDLCAALGLTVGELLGMETREAASVNKVLSDEGECLTVEELSEIAPILPPAAVSDQARKAAGGRKQKMNIQALAEIAAYLDDEFLEELIETVEVNSLAELAPLAPFLDEELLDKLVRKASLEDISEIVALAPFLEEETLDWVVKQCDGEMDQAVLAALAPFLDEDTLDALVDQQIKKGNVGCLSGLYCFMDDETIRKIAKALMSTGDLDALREAAQYL